MRGPSVCDIAIGYIWISWATLLMAAYSPVICAVVRAARTSTSTNLNA